MKIKGFRDEGGFEYKKEIVETILTIIREIPASKEAGAFIARITLEMLIGQRIDSPV